MSQQMDEVMIYKDPVSLLQRLIRFNTTNPPGNEVDCIIYIKGLLEGAGIETKMMGMDAKRQNLVARIKGEGNSPPFLMYGHVDVVSVENQKWTNPPFDGVIKDGNIWGRGALDMKGAVAMMICAFIRAKVEGASLPGDILLCIVCDEENDGTYGAKYLVEEYGDMFKEVRYAIGEIGGFTLHMDNKKFYPIMVAEKQLCRLRTVIKGPGGHGSMPIHGGSMAKLGYVLSKLEAKRLPVHITPPVKQMIDSLAKNLSFPSSAILKQLLNPLMTDKILKLLGDNGNIFDPLLHNMVNATIVHGGDKVNVIPGEVVVEYDGRLLPGFKQEDMLSELRKLLGTEIEFEVTHYEEGPAKVNMGLFDTLGGIIREYEPEGIPIPFVVSGVTDARFFSKLGIQTYGFTPMLLPKDVNFSRMIHAADERIPVEALGFGTNAIFDLLQKI